MGSVSQEHDFTTFNSYSLERNHHNNNILYCASIFRRFVVYCKIVLNIIIYITAAFFVWCFSFNFKVPTFQINTNSLYGYII